MPARSGETPIPTTELAADEWWRLHDENDVGEDGGRSFADAENTR